MKQKDFIITALPIVTIVIVFAALYLFTLPPRDITLKDIPIVAPLESQKEPAIQESAPIDSSEKDDDDKVQINHYIIIGSFGNLMQAQQYAEKIINDFNTNIIVLPPTTEGFYRISYAKYSTLEDAKSAIKSVRTNISSGAWIFSEKK
jgi:hypothetical protein